MSPTSVWWIRRDLRLTDNQALQAARAAAEQVLPVFILDRRLLQSQYVGERRTAFLYGGLRNLDAELRMRGSRLVVREGDPTQVLPQLCGEVGATSVHAERDVSPFAVDRDLAVARALHVPLKLAAGISMRSLDGIRKDDGEPYTVFTPFSRRWQAAGPLRHSDILPAPDRIVTPDTIGGQEIPSTPTLAHDAPFTPGEGVAQQLLSDFVEGNGAPVYRYGQYRDRPDLDATSRLSPYLRFGMLSARLAGTFAYAAIEQAADAAARRSAEVWLTELIWREFYLSILLNFPYARKRSFRPKYERIRWSNNEAEFAAWCAGRTGYPIVDAAMRQLAQTGWMHNRTRMIVASFLVKDLLIDWRWGERWFMQQLVDGDPASNNGGWQWTAGTGTDAAPYFRVFNPVSQGQKFDPDGTYVRTWVPELGQVPDNFIHAPWQMPRSEQIRARCEVGVAYPAPIVDHGAARERVLAVYQAVRS